MKRLHFFTVRLAVSLLFTQIPVCAQSFPVIPVQFNCHFTAFACDTASPWNVEKGMFYLKTAVLMAVNQAVTIHIDTQFYLMNCSFTE